MCSVVCTYVVTCIFPHRINGCTLCTKLDKTKCITTAHQKKNVIFACVSAFANKNKQKNRKNSSGNPQIYIQLIEAAHAIHYKYNWIQGTKHTFGIVLIIFFLFALKLYHLPCSRFYYSICTSRICIESKWKCIKIHSKSLHNIHCLFVSFIYLVYYTTTHQ